MKVAIIGGRSSYTPELIDGFLDRASSLPVAEQWLTEVSRERLDVVGAMEVLPELPLTCPSMAGPCGR